MSSKAPFLFLVEDDSNRGFAQLVGKLQKELDCRVVKSTLGTEPGQEIYRMALPHPTDERIFRAGQIVGAADFELIKEVGTL